jgi:serine/threonine protein kinase/tetratricopeptide (TPR) repeat protein
MPTQPQDDDLVMNLVEQALAQTFDLREAYLRSACSRDPHLFEQVWKYVQWEERMNGFLLDPLYSLPENEHPFEPGQLLEKRFRVVREIARGGMGVVYEAVDEKLGRRIAIKCAKSGFHRRLPPEVRHASEVSHPNVCKTFEIHTAVTAGGEVDFLTMEFVEGKTLAERLSEGPLMRQDAEMIAKQLCLGLAEAHRIGIIHGDLKSNNIILSHTSGGVRAVITDFGLARQPGSQQEAVQSGELGGAPDYMAPELLKGEKPSIASDIYALGVILQEMAVRSRPFGTEATWEERLERRPAPIKHPWHRVVARCLDPEPSRRWSGSSEVWNALRPSHSRRWWLLAAAAALVAAIIGKTELANLAPQETVRLAVLPFQTDGGNSLSNGILVDTSEILARVRHSRARLVIIPVSDALQNKIDQPERAVKVLGATHTLTGTMRNQSGHTVVRALLTDARSNVRLKEFQADYRDNELRDIPVALAGLVTSTLRLPPLSAAATVSPAAYVDFARGVSLMQRDTGVDTALPLLARAAGEDSESPLTHARLAEVQILKFRLTNDAGWRDRAVASLGRAEKLNPDLAVVRLTAGIIHRYEGRYDEAATDLRRALELEPTNGNVWRRLGQVYKDSSRFEEARAAFLKAIEVQPDYFKNYQDLCSLYSNQANYEEAVRQCRKMVQLAPDLWEAHFALALPLLNRGQYAEGERELRLSLQLQETSRALLNLGVALMYQDRNPEAIPSFQRAIELGPPTHLMYLNLGTSLRRAGFPRDAEEAYRKGLALAETELAQNPRDETVRSDLAYLAARLNQRTRAESEAEQARQLAPGSVNVGWMLVLTYESLGEPSRALDVAGTLPDDTLRRLSRFPDLADLHADPRFQELMMSHNIR